ncbi:MAG: hypothetical protein JW996_01955 [Candidatus Cloacimonetes bacterium]|nr:hypothetical protein [Candidatus Cloacimonadota bacterium]
MNERRKILEMIASGKINAEAGDKLLRFLNQREQNLKEGLRFHLIIEKEGKQQPVFQLSFPLIFTETVARIIPNRLIVKSYLADTGFDLGSINWKQILQTAAVGEVGDLFNLEMESSSAEHYMLRIFVS